MLRAVEPLVDVLLVLEQEGVALDLAPSVGLLLELLQDDLKNRVGHVCDAMVGTILHAILEPIVWNR